MVGEYWEDCKKGGEGKERHRVLSKVLIQFSDLIVGEGVGTHWMVDLTEKFSSEEGKTRRLQEKGGKGWKDCL